MADLLWIEQSVDGLIGGKHARQGDHGDDEQASEVLGSPITIGVALVCRAPGQPNATSSGTAVSASATLCTCR